MAARICIIGANSFLARNLVEKFKHKNHYVEGFSRSDTKNVDAHHLFDHPEHPINFDSIINYDVVIYCAGAGIQSEINEQESDIYYLNTFLPIQIVLFLEKKNWEGKFITFGSYFEIGYNNKSLFYTEKDIGVCDNLVPNQYCVSKRLLTRFYSSHQIKIKYYHLILPNIYGKGENENRLIPYIINSVKNSKEIKLTSGSQTRQYIHVDDIAGYVNEIIDKDILSGLYNITNENPIIIKELVKIIHDQMGISCTEEVFGKSQRTDVSMNILLLASSKSSETFKYKPCITLPAGIQSYLK